MAINPINLSNTFGQLVTTTRQCSSELNLLKSGEYVKEAGILNITAPGTSLVANGALFYDNVSVSKSLTVTGKVESKFGYIFPDGSTQISASQSSEYSNSAYAHANSVYVLANNTANTLTTTLAELQAHEANYNNPHKVSAKQLNLSDIATTGSYNDLKDIPLATTDVAGVVKPDGTSINVADGVISTALKTVNNQMPDSSGNVTVASTMVKTVVRSMTPRINVESGKAYICDDWINSLNITGLPGEDNYEESSIWFRTTDIGTSVSITIASGIPYKIVGDLTIEGSRSYVLSIMANTLILEEVQVVS